jgi:hypothetical protein
MGTDLRYSEPSSRAFERETAASAEQWSNWTTNQICSAIEAEREWTLELLTEVLVRIKNDMIPEVVAMVPALRGPAGPVGPGGKLPIARIWRQDEVTYEAEVRCFDGGLFQALKDTAQLPGLAATLRQAALALRSRSNAPPGQSDVSQHISNPPIELVASAWPRAHKALNRPDKSCRHTPRSAPPAVCRCAIASIWAWAATPSHQGRDRRSIVP